MILFNDPVTFGGIFSILLGITAGLVYSYAKNKQRKDQQQGRTRSIQLSKLERDAEGNMLSIGVSNGFQAVASSSKLKEEVRGQSGAIVSQVHRL